MLRSNWRSRRSRRLSKPSCEFYRQKFSAEHFENDASSVPILQLGLSRKTLGEQDLYDLGQNFIRTQLATVEGAWIPLPYGGKTPQVMVDLIPDALYAKRLSALRHRQMPMLGAMVKTSFRPRV
jgi:hypothetical protein